MIRSLWIAKTGMEAQQSALDAVSHNLANASTNGYKRGHAVFEDLMYQNLRQVGADNAEGVQLPTGLQVGLGVRTVAMSRNFSQGGLQQTENTLDLAINGQGFFQIQMPDGTLAYTRDGAFQLNSQGQLVTSGGYAVQPGITVPADADSVTVGRDGTVRVKLPGQTETVELGQITTANFINPAGLDPRGENLYVESAASGGPQVGAPGSANLGVLNQGMVETSNVNVVTELVTMIQTQRAYEMNSKAVSTSDQMLSRLGQL